MPEFILILVIRWGDNHVSMFSDVKFARTLCHQDVLTWESFTVNFLRTKVMLTVYCLYKRQGKLTLLCEN